MQQGNEIGISSFSENSVRYRDPFYYIAWLSIVDFLAIMLGFFIPWYLKIGIYDRGIEMPYFVALVLFEAIFFSLAASERLYSEDRLHSIRQSVASAWRLVAVTAGCLLLVAFVIKETSTFSRVWGGSWVSLVCAYILISRVSFCWFLSTLMERRGGRRVLLIGDANQAREILNAFERARTRTCKVIGFLGAQDDLNDSSSSGERGRLTTLGISMLDTAKALEAHIDELCVDDVIIVSKWTKVDLIKNVVRRASNRCVNVFLAPETMIELGGARFRSVDTVSLLEVARKPIDRWQSFLKRAEDIFLSIVAIVGFLPIMILVAIAIKLESKGPILFIQPRYGFNNELINVWKFRSMRVEASDKTAAKQTTRNDDRLTRVGRFIRKTSLDELPQFFNVLAGSMSLVGPRPHATETKAAGRLFEDVVDQYSVRHRVKPGVTGWAQVNGWRGETDTEEKIKKRVEYDLYYIDNWSLGFDVYILLRTFYAVWASNENVY